MTELLPGTEVIYGLHGKCKVDAVVSREIGGAQVAFYRLQVVKSPSARTKTVGPTIMLPVSNSAQLRAVMSETTAATCLSILEGREFYFPIDLTWEAVRPKLDHAILLEGPQGLAKVYSYLWVLAKRSVVPPTEVARMMESVERVLFRELSEVLQTSMASIHTRIARGLKSKLAPDT